MNHAVELVIAAVLTVVGYATLCRAFYIKGRWAGWRRGFEDGIALEKKNRQDHVDLAVADALAKDSLERASENLELLKSIAGVGPHDDAMIH